MMESLLLLYLWNNPLALAITVALAVVSVLYWCTRAIEEEVTKLEKVVTTKFLFV